MTGKAAATLISMLLVPATLAACGNTRTAPPDLSRPAAPTGSTARGFPYLGLQFRSATNWSYVTGRPPLVAMMSSGQGLVAIWRYPRLQPLPAGLAQLRRARHALVLAARARDATFVAAQGRIVSLAGAPAIELLGHETVAGQPRMLRSVHVYVHGAEFVIDALAPAEYFAQIDASLFVPLLATLRFPPPVAAGPAYAAGLAPSRPPLAIATPRATSRTATPGLLRRPAPVTAAPTIRLPGAPPAAVPSGPSAVPGLPAAGASPSRAAR